MASRLILSISAAVLSGISSVQAPARPRQSLSLFEAELVNVRQARRGPLHSFDLPGGGVAAIDGTYALTLKPTRAVYGNLPRTTLHMVVASAHPRIGSRYYIVAEERAGRWEVLWKDTKYYGFCTADYLSTEFPLLRDAVRRQATLDPCTH
jgi:hypothetical protein